MSGAAHVKCRSIARIGYPQEQAYQNCTPQNLFDFTPLQAHRSIDGIPLLKLKIDQSSG
jgi:hypothetical protein